MNICATMNSPLSPLWLDLSTPNAPESMEEIEYNYWEDSPVHKNINEVTLQPNEANEPYNGLLFSIDNRELFGLARLSDDFGEPVEPNAMVSKSQISREMQMQFGCGNAFTSWFLSLKYAVYIRRVMFLFLFCVATFTDKDSVILLSVYLGVLGLYLVIGLSLLETRFLLFKNIASFDFMFLLFMNIAICVSHVLQRWETQDLLTIICFTLFRFLWCTAILLSDSFIHWSRRTRMINNALFIAEMIRILVSDYLTYDLTASRDHFCFSSTFFSLACVSLQALKTSGAVTISIFLLKHIITDLYTLIRNEKPIFLIINSAVRIELASTNIKLSKSLKPVGVSRIKSLSFARFPDRDISRIFIYSDLNYLQVKEKIPLNPLFGTHLFQWISMSWVQFMAVVIGILPSLLINILAAAEVITNVMASEIASIVGILVGLIHLFAAFDRGILRILFTHFDSIYLIFISLIHMACYIGVIIKSASNLAIYRSVEISFIYAAGIADAVVYSILFMTFFLSDALIFGGRNFKLIVVFLMSLHFIYAIYVYLFVFPLLKLPDGTLVYQTVSFCYKELCFDMYSIRTQTLIIVACFLLKILYRLIFFPKATVLLKSRVSYEIMRENWKDIRIADKNSAN